MKHRITEQEPLDRRPPEARGAQEQRAAEGDGDAERPRDGEALLADGRGDREARCRLFHGARLGRLHDDAALPVLFFGSLRCQPF